MKIESTQAFENSLRKLSDDDLSRLAQALDRLVKTFGSPHEHRGLRKLRRNIYEFRIGIAGRVVFRSEPGTLYLLLLGTHDEIQRFLKTL